MGSGKQICLGAVLLIFLSSASLAHAEVTVVVSPANPLKQLTIEQAAHLFLGKTTHFPDGSPARVIDLPEGSAIRDAFYQKLVGKSPVNMKAYWAKMIFTGKGVPPKEVPDSMAVKRLITSNPAYIGYLSDDDIDVHVKLVPLTGEVLSGSFKQRQLHDQEPAHD